MNYENFLQCMQERIQKQVHDGCTVTLNHVIKNNGCELDGLVIMEKGRNVAPTIYLNAFYEAYENGMYIEDIIHKILQVYMENKDKINVNPEFFTDYESVRYRIAYKLIHYEQNTKLLEVVPHRRFLDLAIVYYCMIEQFEDINATALIYNTHMTHWGITEEELYETAHRNSPNILKSVLRPMSAIIDNIVESSEQEDFLQLESEEMYVLTNESKLHGASCILYEGLLKNLSDYVNKDLYILPSSIHEVIIVPKHECYTKAELEDMVCEVNTENVSTDEVLSNHVYTYHRKSNLITL